MTQAGFTFTVHGDKQLSRSLSRFGEGAKDMRPAFRLIAKSFRAIEKKQFDSGGSYGSGGWAPLSLSYAEWKELNFPGMGLLQRTGALMASLVGKTDDSIEEIEKLTMSIGTKLNYALYHQLGTPTMPARPIIELTEDDKRGWMKIIHRSLVGKAKKEGLSTR